MTLNAYDLTTKIQNDGYVKLHEQNLNEASYIKLMKSFGECEAPGYFMNPKEYPEIYLVTGKNYPFIIKIVEKPAMGRSSIISIEVDRKKIMRLDNEERVLLFDGTSIFKIGTDDTLRNMRWRIDKVAKINIAGEILLEIFLRLQEHDTVFKRLRDRHSRSKTGWW